MTHISPPHLLASGLPRIFCGACAKGERRFYLGAVVDDMFLKTAEFAYGKGPLDENGEPWNEGNVR